MFVREIKANRKTYLHIIKSYRENGQVKQKSIAALGATDTLKGDQLRHIAESLLRYCQDHPNFVDISQAEEVSRKRWGAVRVFRKLWENFGFSKFFSSMTWGIQFDLFSTVFLMVLDRLIDPKSKRKSYEEQDRYHGIESASLHHLYRALDRLAQCKENLEAFLFEKNKTLWNMKVDVVLYDVTTLYFESVRMDPAPEGEDSGAFRNFGFSKDGKIKEVQVMLGLLVDWEGRPIGFDVFPGNTFEGDTLKKALEKLSKRFQIHRLIFVADAGLLSETNIAQIKACGYEYILGGRLKNKSQKIKAEVLNETGYEKIAVTEDELKVKSIPVGSDVLICTWSKKRAEKDQHDRERIVLKAKTMLEKKSSALASKRGVFRYIAKKSSGRPTLDEKKIQADAAWDGYFGIQTNAKDYSTQALLGYYHDLWRIEESFRLWKTHLETRPMFHWTPDRIQGHLVVCFLAFLLERTLEIELRKNKIDYSAERIRKALDDLQFSEIVIGKQTFYLRSAVQDLANDILRTVKVKIPPQISTPENFG